MILPSAPSSSSSQAISVCAAGIRWHTEFRNVVMRFGVWNFWGGVFEEHVGYASE